MARRAVIGINGDQLPFDEITDSLQTQGFEGGLVTWVPKGDTQHAILTATANGDYNSGDVGVSYWEYVAVFVTGGSVTGLKNGVRCTVTVDNDGYLVYTET